MVRKWLCGRVPDLQSGGCGFESRPGLPRTKVYSAFHPSGVGKWVPAAAGKAKAGTAHSDCAWTCGCAGKTVKSLENTCHTWALLRRWFITKRRYINVYAPLPLPLPLLLVHDVRVSIYCDFFLLSFFILEFRDTCDDKNVKEIPFWSYNDAQVRWVSACVVSVDLITWAKCEVRRLLDT